MTAPLSRRNVSHAPVYLASILCAIAGTSLAQSTYTFDSTDGRQVWDLSTNNWTGAVWANSNHAQFNGPGIEVDLDASIIANSLLFGADGFVLKDSNGTSGSLSLATNGSINVSQATDTAEISEILAGSAWIKNGDGVLLLSGENTFTGAVTLNAGTLKIGHARALGDAAGNTAHVVALDGTLDLNGFTLAVTEQFLDFKGTLINSNTQTNAVILGQIGPNTGSSVPFTVDGAGNMVLANVDRSIITKNGSGTLTLNSGEDNNAAQLIANEGLVLLAKTSTTNSRAVGSGLWINNDAVVRINASNGSGNNGDQIYSNSNATLSGNGTLELNGYNESFNGLIGNSGYLVNGAASGTATVSLGEGHHATAAFHGILANHRGTGSSVLALRKHGRGTQTLTNQNTYTGLTTVENGTLHLDFADAAGSTAPNNIIHASSALMLNASSVLNLTTLRITGEAGVTNSQTFNGTTIQGAGLNRVALNGHATGGVTLDLGALNYNHTALVDFTWTAQDRITTSTSDRLLTGRATVHQGESFAQIKNGEIAAFEGDLVYQTDTVISSLSGYASDKTLRVDGTSTGELQASTGALQLASVLITDTEERAWNVGDQGKIVLGVGGTILRNRTAGSFTIGEAPSAGTLTAGTSSGQNLVLHNANIAGNLTVHSSIVNNAGGSTQLVITGAEGGRTILTGNNTYTGTTLVTKNHILRISSSNALGGTGSLSASGTYLAEGATLELEGDISVGNEALQVWGSGINNAGAIRNLSGNNLWGGVVTFSANSSIFSNSGTLTFDVASGNALTVGNFQLIFNGAGNVEVLDTIVQGGTNNNHIIKDGAGTLTLSANNTFTGTGVFYIRNQGKVIITHGGALGGTTGRTQVESGGSLELRGGITSNENITINNTLGQTGGRGAILSGQGSNTLSGILTIDNGTGRVVAEQGSTLTFSNTTSAIIGDPDANSTRMVQLNGPGDIVVAGGGIKNGTGSNSVLQLSKEGSGKLTLSGANTYTGTSSLSFGSLALDYSTSNTSKLADGSATTLRQIEVELQGGSHEEVVQSTVLTADSKVSIHRSSGSSTLNLNAITVESNAALEIAQENLVRTDNLNTNGILGAWATIKDTGWATNSTNAADGFITAYTGYSDLSRLGGVINSQTSANYRIVESGNTSGAITLGATLTDLNTLLMSAASANPSANTAMVEMTGRTLRFGSQGGIMMLSGANGLEFGAGGTLTAGGSVANTAGTLALINESTTQNLVIRSVLANNGTGALSLRKDGAGTVELHGNHTFTGKLVATGGTLKAIGHANALGSGTATLSLANTTLHLVHDSSTDFNRATTLNGDATIVIDRVNAGAGVTHRLDALTFSESFTLNVKKGDNITSGIAGLVFDGRHTTGLSTKAIDSTFNVDQDVELSLIGSVNSGSGQYGHITKNGAGTLILDGTRSYWEGINLYLNAGKLEVRNAGALGDDNPVNGPIHAANETVVQLTNNTDSNFLSPLNVVGESVSVIVSRATAGSSISHTMDNLYLGGNTLNVSAGSTVQDSAQLTFSGASTVGAGARLNLTDADLVLANTVSGKDGSLEKTGAASLFLNGANTYTGGTTVSAGTVFANNTTGSATGSGNVLVKAGATLAGDGTVGLNTSAQNITLQQLSILRVGRGKSPAAAGEILTLANRGAGQIQLLGQVQIDLFGNDGGLNPAAKNDVLKLVSDQSIQLSGTLAVNDVSGTSTAWTEGSSWRILDFSGVDAQSYTSGAFTSFELPTLDAALTWKLDELYTNGIISIAAVPEPSRLMLLFGACFGWLMRRKRKN